MGYSTPKSAGLEYTHPPAADMENPMFNASIYPFQENKIMIFQNDSKHLGLFKRNNATKEFQYI